MEKRRRSEVVDDRARKGRIGSVWANTDDRFEVVREICNVAVVSLSELARDKFIGPMNVYDYRRIEQRGEGNNACSAAAPVRDELFAKLERGAVAVGFEIFGVPVLSKLADGTDKLGGGREEELSEGV